MTLRNHIRPYLLAMVVCVMTIGLFFVLRAYVWLPYRARTAALSLPAVPQNLTAVDLGLPDPTSSFNCRVLPVTLTNVDLETQSALLESTLRGSPADLCAGNQFREAERYLGLRTGQFAIKTRSLPPSLATLAKDSEAIPAEDQIERSVPPDEIEPAKLFRSLVISRGGDNPETELQLGLSYIDLMVRHGGREDKARLSSRSIEALTAALRRRPYMVAALYARGLNYLYWPVIAGKLPLAAKDLKTCIALSNLPALKDTPPLVIAEAYRALGDSYVRFADSTMDTNTEKALLDAGRTWWEEGRRRFPNYRGFDERLTLPDQQLATYVDSTRSLETYIDTDLALLWSR